MAFRCRICHGTAAVARYMFNGIPCCAGCYERECHRMMNGAKGGD